MVGPRQGESISIEVFVPAVLPITFVMIAVTKQSLA